VTAPSVLVVDDDELQRELVTDYLMLSGFVVRTAADGREGLAVMRRQPPDLVLLDVQMPELDGVAVIRLMRAEPTLATVPVLVLSGVEAPHVRIRAFELGADDFVSKQCSPAELVARVRAALRRRPAPPSATLAGTLDPAGGGLGLDDAVQTLLVARRTGRLRLLDLAAEVDCADGAIVAARHGTHTGRDALDRIALTARGRFTVEVAGPPGPIAAPGPAPAAAVEEPPRPAGLSLLAAMVAVDEARGALPVAETAMVTLAAGQVAEPLARRRALFPLTIVDLLVSLDGDLRSAVAVVAAGLAAGQLVSPSPQRKVS